MLYKQDRKEILKADFDQWGDVKPDKMDGIPAPPLLKAPMGGEKVDLVKEFDNIVLSNDFLNILEQRKSYRKFTERSLSLDELAYLLWYTQGIKKITDSYTFRTVPSGGIRHPFETYLMINYVDGIVPGIYHYLPEDHSLELLFEDEDRIEKMKIAARNQKYVADCAVTFIWSCVPYRTEWRYHMSSYKTILLDAGHVCQNLYLACGAIGCGTVAIGNYDQKYLDEYLGLDGDDEFVIYMAPVGKV